VKCQVFLELGLPFPYPPLWVVCELSDKVPCPPLLPPKLSTLGIPSLRRHPLKVEPFSLEGWNPPLLEFFFRGFSSFQENRSFPQNPFFDRRIVRSSTREAFSEGRQKRPPCDFLFLREFRTTNDFSYGEGIVDSLLSLGLPPIRRILPPEVEYLSIFLSGG